MPSTNTHKTKALLIDLDDCLYRNETMPKLGGKNQQGKPTRFPTVAEYMMDLGIPEAEVADRCAALYLKYGTTLAGLVVSY
eukprot:1152466-Pelagomonas_calceolata.AAC.3